MAIAKSKLGILFIIAILAGSLFLFGCPDNRGNGNNGANVSTVANGTSAAGASNASTAVTGTGTGKAANWGDYVDVDYTLYDQNGTVLDTSLSAVAINASIYSKQRIYTPLSVAMKQNNGYIAGFTQGLIGMKAGESKQVVIEPKDGYGEWDPTLVKEMAREYTISRFETQPIDLLESKNITNITLNKTIVTTFWYARVVNISDDGTKVTLRNDPSENQIITISGMEQEVTNVTNDTLTFKLLPVLGKTYTFADPQTGQAQQARVYAMNDTSVSFDYNGAMAGKTLIFDLKVIKVS